MGLEVVILAAGMGKRMHSSLPKVLHKLAGKPLLQHVIETAAQLEPRKIHVVLGHGAAKVEEMLHTLPPELQNLTDTVIQHEQLGTGHAVLQALPLIAADAKVLVLYGDTPLTPAQTLKDLTCKLTDQALIVLTSLAPNPFGYGRIVRRQDQLEKIVEEKDASAEEKQIREVNTGIIAAPCEILKTYLPKLGNNNAQGEYYLTDLAGMLVQEHKQVSLEVCDNFDFFQGVNSKVQLSQVERLYQQMQALRLMEAGVMFADPKRFDLRGSLSCGTDCFIDINCVFEGEVKLGNEVSIGPGCVLRDCVIGDKTVLSPYTVIEGSELKQATTVGPFARIRPGSVLEDRVHVGNFVEVKKSTLKADTKAGHLSYLGDATIGVNVNIGAGTITCNYDGANKFRTEIGDEVFVGSDTQLVAPVTIPKGVTIGAGTTVTHRLRIPENALVVTRAKDTIIPNFPRPTKKKS
ncbi:MAG: bifunctional UDP-N-acetylglucosamine diphosphorylase/glucosamine-1-phosphate N-acetyltransferase GlmU [Succinivibrio sp.]|nr:bifunctional UDP-N-acetylglucosamine diphosphorylase/glucosamine-1-phosphate N-acetyltransferase GlmU [Succinivibrio sp.]